MEQGSTLENKPGYSGTLDQKTFRSVIRRAVAIPFVLVAVFGGFMLWQLDSRINDAAWVDHTDRAIALGQELAFDFANSSAHLRGYLRIKPVDASELAAVIASLAGRRRQPNP